MSIKERIAEIVGLIEEKNGRIEEMSDGFLKNGIEVDYEKITSIRQEIAILENDLEKLSMLVKVEELVEMTKELLPIGEMAADLVKTELVNIVKLPMLFIFDTVDQLEPELNRMATLKAKALYRDYNALKKVGFPSRLADSIILAQVSAKSSRGIVGDLKAKAFENSDKVAKVADKIKTKIS